MCEVKHEDRKLVKARESHFELSNVFCNGRELDPTDLNNLTYALSRVRLPDVVNDGMVTEFSSMEMVFLDFVGVDLGSVLRKMVASKDVSVEIDLYEPDGEVRKKILFISTGKRRLDGGYLDYSSSDYRTFVVEFEEFSMYEDTMFIFKRCVLD